MHKNRKTEIKQCMQGRTARDCVGKQHGITPLYDPKVMFPPRAESGRPMLKSLSFRQILDTNFRIQMYNAMRILFYHEPFIDSSPFYLQNNV